MIRIMYKLMIRVMYKLMLYLFFKLTSKSRVTVLAWITRQTNGTFNHYV
jgi:hypothetical protein